MNYSNNFYDIYVKIVKIVQLYIFFKWTEMYKKVIFREKIHTVLRSLADKSFHLTEVRGGLTICMK